MSLLLPSPPCHGRCWPHPYMHVYPTRLSCPPTHIAFGSSPASAASASCSDLPPPRIPPLSSSPLNILATVPCAPLACLQVVAYGTALCVLFLFSIFPYSPAGGRLWHRAGQCKRAVIGRRLHIWPGGSIHVWAGRCSPGGAPSHIIRTFFVPQGQLGPPQPTQNGALQSIGSLQQGATATPVNI